MRDVRLALSALLLAAPSSFAHAQCADGTPEPCRSRVRADSNVLVVLPFAVRGPAQHAWLGESIMDLLQTAFDGVGKLRVEYAPTNLRRLDALADRQNPRAAAGLALEFGAARVLAGTINVLGSEVRIRADMYDATRNSVQFSVERRGSVDNFGAVVDSLGSAILARRLVPATDRQRLNAGEYDTRSPKALQAFAVARRIERGGNRKVAAESLLSALKQDPDFGPARYRLLVIEGAQGGVTGVQGGRFAILNDALKHRDKYSERIRTLLDIKLARRTERARALALVDQVAAQYPNDPDVAFEQADAYFHHGINLGVPRERVLEVFRRALAVDDENLELNQHYLVLLWEAGDSAGVARATANCRRFRQTGCLEDGVSRAIFGARTAREIAVGPDSLAWTQHFFVRARAAEPAFGLALTDSFAVIQTSPGREPMLRNRAYLIRSHVALGNGRYRDAWALMDSAAAVMAPNPPADIHRWARLPAIVTGERVSETLALPYNVNGPLQVIAQTWLAVARLPADSALPLVRAWESRFWGDTTLDRAVGEALRGALAARAGDTVTARRLLLSAREVETGDTSPYRLLNPSCWHAVQLARIELRVGSAANARRYLADAYPANSCIPFLGDIEETQGHIALALNDTATARRSFANVIALWDKADPPLQPRVTAAREALARLTPR
jgi:tetratricopeptide (TPR) repeat protein